MRILFLARHFTYFRNFEAVIRLLSSRGHRIHLAVDRDDGRSIAVRLTRECPGLSYGMTPEVSRTRDTKLAEGVRLALDFLRYQDRSYDEAPKIRQRASLRTPRGAAWLSARIGRDRAAAWLRALESAVPPPGPVLEFIDAHQPDLVLFTPLIELGSSQLDYLRAAKMLGNRTALCVWSWDHLTSKALIRVRPDRVLVWNETQKREAVDLHGVPAGDVIVTGAQCFDQWFASRPTRGRGVFCARAGLPDARPYVLYMCSALFKGSPPESGFVRRWLHALRTASDPLARGARVLVRPHPQRLAEWDGIDLGREFTDVALFGSNPIDAESRADYFDSMYYAAAVVGLNTSALIEAAIVDRPVYTVLLPEFHDNQEGTFHFQYLLKVGDGFLHAARSLEEHCGQLADGLRGVFRKSNRRFVGEFIRPAGLDVPATPAFADAVESVGALSLHAPVRQTHALGARLAAAVLKTALRSEVGRRWLMDPRSEREAEKKAVVLRDREQRYATKRCEHRGLVWRRRRQRVVAAAKTAVLRTGLVPGRFVPLALRPGGSRGAESFSPADSPASNEGLEP